MPFAEISTGARLFYEEHNPDAATPVVLLHGLLGTGRTNLGHVIDWLAAEGYRVIAPSLRGYGESTPKPRDFPLKFYERDADDVIALVDALNLPPAHLLGYSDGGEVALICAGKASDRWLSIGAIGALGQFVPQMRARVMGYRPGSEWISQEEIDLHGIPDADAFSAQWVRSVVQMIDSGGDIGTKYAPQVTAPVLIMLGERDGLNPPQGAEDYLKQVKNGRLMMFDAGHPVHDEQPDAFKRAYLGFIHSV